MSVAADRRSLRPPSTVRPLGPRNRQPRSSTAPPTVGVNDPQRLSVVSSNEASSTETAETQQSLPDIVQSRPSTPATPNSNHSTHSYSPSPSPAPSLLSVKPVYKVPTLTAPNVKFESTTVGFKGLPLEAALWTFDSKELQKIVSRAIRSSAKESFIRLLSVENLDTVIPAEIEHLQSLKATKQSRYRFNVQRRTMLLQALVSFSATDAGKEQDGGTALVGRLATQLSEITADCDSLAEELVNITDQLTQLHRLLDLHWASALAVALRKLNTSYGKRTKELNTARERVSQLEAELEDAWKEAEKIAQEMDDLDAVIASDDEADEEDDDDDGEEPTMDNTAAIIDEGTAVIDRAEVVSIASKKSVAPVNGTPMSGTILNIQPISPVAFSPISLIPEPSIFASTLSMSSQSDVLIGVGEVPPPKSPIIVDDKPPPLPPKDTQFGIDSDKISLRSRRSTKSFRSTRSSDTSRVNVVSAARVRSQRASIASLRLPRSLRDAPPVPDLPKNLNSRPPSSFHLPGLQGSRRSFLDIGPSTPSTPDAYRSASSSRLRQRTSIDDLQLIMRHVDVDGNFLSRPQSTVDDIGVMPPRTPLTDEIEEVPRTPTSRFGRSFDDSVVPMTTLHQPVEGVLNISAQPNDAIPSIWLNIDAPKTPAERVAELSRKPSSSYFRIKTFTKRYSMSMPFPRLKAISPIKSHR